MATGDEFKDNAEFVVERWAIDNANPEHPYCVWPYCYASRLEGVPCCAEHQLLVMANSPAQV